MTGERSRREQMHCAVSDWVCHYLPCTSSMCLLCWRCTFCVSILNIILRSSRIEVGHTRLSHKSAFIFYILYSDRPPIPYYGHLEGLYSSYTMFDNKVRPFIYIFLCFVIKILSFKQAITLFPKQHLRDWPIAWTIINLYHCMKSGILVPVNIWKSPKFSVVNDNLQSVTSRSSVQHIDGNEPRCMWSLQRC